MKRMDLLGLANELDEAWHGQPRSFEREAVTRFWGLLTLPARALDPALPRKMLRQVGVLRNARFTGRAVHEMFFEDQDFTEVDALFLGVGSPLGHTTGDDAWVVEVERKQGNRQGDYFRAIHRAKRFAELLGRRFGVRVRPVVVYEDEGGKLSYRTFDGDVLLMTMSVLRDRTRGLSFSSVDDIPGAGCDRTMLKLALLNQLVRQDPNVPGGFGSAAGLVREAEAQGWPVRLPVVGHQDADRFPARFADWLERERETDERLEARARKYLREMHEGGLLDRLSPQARLSYDGGHVVLRTQRTMAQESA